MILYIGIGLLFVVGGLLISKALYRHFKSRGRVRKIHNKLIDGLVKNIKVSTKEKT